MLDHSGVAPEQRHSPTYVRTSGRMVSALDPFVNILRCTTAAFAAAVAGADGITVLPFDEPATGSPAPLGRRMARNTQLLLMEEASLHRVADPAGGSWYVESLTEQIAQAAWAKFQELERDGGIIAALENGTVAKLVAEATAERHDAFSRRRRSLTGVNQFPLLGDDGLERAERITAGDPDLELGEGLTEADAEVELSAPDSGGLVPVRDAAQFEALRVRAAEIAAQRGREPQIVLVNLGPLSEHVNVNLWAKSFFEAGGIETVSVTEDQFEGGEFVAVCAGKDRDPGPVIAQLRDAGAETVYLASATQDAAEAAGADVGVRDGVDMVAVLGELSGEVRVMSIPDFSDIPLDGIRTDPAAGTRGRGRGAVGDARGDRDPTGVRRR